MPTLDLTVGLGVVGRGLHVSHTGQTNKLLKVLGNELWAIVGDDSWSGLGELFAGPLEDGFDVGFLHFFADFPVNDVSAEAVEDRALEVKSSRDIEVADIDVPVLMGQQRLLKSSSFFGGFGGKSCQESGIAKYAIDRRRATSNDISVEHHVGQSPIAF